MIESVNVIARLCKHFEFSIAPDFTLETEAMVTLHPKNGVMLKVKKMKIHEAIPDKIVTVLDETVHRYRNHLLNRNPKLFTNFLPLGYETITLTSVEEAYREEVMIAKCHVAIFITLLDDYADNPDMANPTLLNELYKIPFNKTAFVTLHLNHEEKEIVALAVFIANEFMRRIKLFPLYNKYIKIFEFDLRQFFNCNQFFSLATDYPDILNSYEVSYWGPFNMGMIITSIIDLMASPYFRSDELGKSREFFYLAQRFGKTCNTITTFSRELSEQDFNNEVIVMGLAKSVINKDDLTTLSANKLLEKLQPILSILTKEQLDILKKLNHLGKEITSFDTQYYIHGLNRLQNLHEHFIGII